MNDLTANIASISERMASLQARFGVRPPVSDSAILQASIGGSGSGSSGSSTLFDSLLDQASMANGSDGGGDSTNVGDFVRALIDSQPRPVATTSAAVTQVQAQPLGQGETSPANVSGNQIVGLASQYLGVPYVWGGDEPSTGLDCSGLVQQAYADAGIDLPRVSRDQARVGVPVASLADAVPGDLVAFGDPVDHIGIYAGNGKMVVAPHTGDVVKVQDITKEPTAIRRVLMAPAAGFTSALTISALNTSTLNTSTLSSGTQTAGTSTAASAGTAATNDPAAQFRPLFQAAGSKYGVSPDLLESVARAESGFDPTAVSGAGAQGLMQLMPTTAAALGVDPLDPAAAVDGSARLLSQHLRRYGSVRLALAAYNAGPGNVDKYNGVPPFSETQNYVRKIMADLAGSTTAAIAGQGTSPSPAAPATTAASSISGFNSSTATGTANRFGIDITSTDLRVAGGPLINLASTSSAPVTSYAAAATAVTPAPAGPVTTTAVTPVFVQPTGTPIRTEPGSWGPNTQTGVTSLGGDKTVSWGAAGLLAAAKAAEIAAIAPSASGPVAKGVLKILTDATPDQMRSKEFRKTVNDVNRDALGLPDAPDVIPVDPPPLPVASGPAPAPAPAAAPVAAPPAAPAAAATKAATIVRPLTPATPGSGIAAM